MQLLLDLYILYIHESVDSLITEFPMNHVLILKFHLMCSVTSHFPPNIFFPHEKF